MINQGEQTNRGYTGLGKRNINPRQDIPMIRAVHKCRLLQFFRNCPEKVQHQHHTEYRNRTGKDQRPYGSQQMYTFNCHIPGNQPRIDQHGDKKEPGISRPHPQLAVIL